METHRFTAKIGAPIAGVALLLLFGGCSLDPSEDRTAGALEKGEIRFVDVTASAGLGEFRHVSGAQGNQWFPEIMGAGVAFFHYDDDDWLDIAVVSGGVWPNKALEAPPALELFRNNQQGGFEHITEEAGLAGIHAFGFGIQAADIDNDGDADLLLTTLHRNLLFLNEGGVYREAGVERGLGEEQEWSTAALFFDANNDGWVDVLIGNYVIWTPENDIRCTLDGENKSYCAPHQYEGQGSRFYLNRGDGYFEEATSESGLEGGTGKTLGLAELDLDGDGWVDILMANDTQRDLLYRNLGGGTFEEIGLASGIAFDQNGVAKAGMGVDVGDLENNGRPNIVVGTFPREMTSIFRYTGNGIFSDRSAASGVGVETLLVNTFGLFLFDVELDGDLDIFQANGHIYTDVDRIQNGVSFRQPAQIFLNDGAGLFESADRADDAVLSKLLVGRGAAYGDYDRDGDLDILLSENDGPVHLWRNDTAGGNALVVQLVGNEASHEALGSRVVIWTGNLRQERRIRTGSSYLSQSSLAAWFGLGDVELVDSLSVYWPNGKVTKMTEVTAGEVEIVENEPS